MVATGTGQDRRLGLECVFVGIAGDRLNIDGQGRLIKGKDLYNVRNAKARRVRLFLGVLIACFRFCLAW